MAHVHAALIQQFARDATEHDDPGQFWECSGDNGKTWNSFCNGDCPSFCLDYKYRRKQETIYINGHKVPKPLRIDEIEDNMIYYAPSFSHITNYIELSGDGFNIRYFAKKGLLHETKEAAIAHAKALLSFTEQK